jgi:hypothetical protein
LFDPQHIGGDSPDTHVGIGEKTMAERRRRVVVAVVTAASPSVVLRS